MKKTFGSDSVFTRACHLLQSRLLRLCRNQTEGHIRTFCADAVLAPREDRHVSSPSDCFFGYHSPSAITRSLGLWFLSATSRSFHWLWLPPEGFRPTAPHLFYSA